MKAHDPILVSACLLGINCRYDGTSNFSQEVLDYLHAKHRLPIPVCPEQLAGLPTPRSKVWFTQGDGHKFLDGEGDLIDEHGLDCGPAFLRGANEVYKIAKACRCTQAILKQRSPSCGNKQVYLNKRLVAGAGLTCALLEQAGLETACEESLEQLK